VSVFLLSVLLVGLPLSLEPGVDPGFFLRERGAIKKRQQHAIIFCDEKVIDMRSQTSLETSQRGVLQPFTMEARQCSLS